MNLIKDLLAKLLFATLLFGGAAQATPAYNIHIDTATLGSGPAYLGLYFLGVGDAAPATATVDGLAGAFSGPAQITGAVSGTWPGPLAFGNGGELVQEVSLGGVLSFQVSFALGSGNAGLSFGWALFNDSRYLGADGDLGSISLLPGTAEVVSNFSPLSSVQAVPEPQALLMLAFGLMCVAWQVRRRR